MRCTDPTNPGRSRAVAIAVACLCTLALVFGSQLAKAGGWQSPFKTAKRFAESCLPLAADAGTDSPATSANVTTSAQAAAPTQVPAKHGWRQYFSKSAGTVAASGRSGEWAKRFFGDTPFFGDENATDPFLEDAADRPAVTAKVESTPPAEFTNPQSASGSKVQDVTLVDGSDNRLGQQAGKAPGQPADNAPSTTGPAAVRAAQQFPELAIDSSQTAAELLHTDHNANSEIESIETSELQPVSFDLDATAAARKQVEIRLFQALWRLESGKFDDARRHAVAAESLAQEHKLEFRSGELTPSQVVEAIEAHVGAANADLIADEAMALGETIPSLPAATTTDSLDEVVLTPSEGRPSVGDFQPPSSSGESSSADSSRPLGERAGEPIRLESTSSPFVAQSTEMLSPTGRSASNATGTLQKHSAMRPEGLSEVDGPTVGGGPGFPVVTADRQSESNGWRGGAVTSAGRLTANQAVILEVPSTSNASSRRGRQDTFNIGSTEVPRHIRARTAALSQPVVFGQSLLPEVGDDLGTEPNQRPIAQPITLESVEWDRPGVTPSKPKELSVVWRVVVSIAAVVLVLLGGRRTLRRYDESVWRTKAKLRLAFHALFNRRRRRRTIS